MKILKALKVCNNNFLAFIVLILYEVIEKKPYQKKVMVPNNYFILFPILPTF